jgi:hypothetical protein
MWHPLFSFGDGVAVEPEDDAVLDHRRYRRKYIVRRKDELFVFDNPFDAQQFERDLNPPPAPRAIAKAQKRVAKLVKSNPGVSLPGVVQSAPDWAKAQLEALIEKAQYARMLEMVAELEEEDELELILLYL